MRNLSGSGVTWEDQWEDEEGLIVGDLRRSRVEQEKSLGEEALMKESRVSRQKLRTFLSVSKHRVAPELCSAHPVLAHDLFKQRCVSLARKREGNKGGPLHGPDRKE